MTALPKSSTVRRAPAAMLARALLFLVLALGFAAPVRAADPVKGDVKVYTDGGYTRLKFQFESEVDATVRLAAGILVISFKKPVDVAVDRINAALDLQTKRMDDLALRQARPALDGRGKIVTDAASREHKSAFDAYVRSGEASALRQIETKAMSAGSSTDGGYLVPSELESEIGERLAAISPIRASADCASCASSSHCAWSNRNWRTIVCA